MQWKCPECGFVSVYSTLKCPCGYEATGSEERIETVRKDLNVNRQPWFWPVIIAAALAGAVAVNTFFGSLNSHVRWLLATLLGFAIGGVIDQISKRGMRK